MSADSLWRDRAFTLFWAARAVSITGSTITAVVLPILVYQLTGSPFQTALLTTLEVLPYFVFGLFAGAVADRVNRRRLMVVCNLIQALLVGSIPLAAAFGALTLTHIYAAALLSMTAFVWFDAANFGALPALVGRERLVAANSAIWSTTTIVGIVGPALGGVLAATIGPALVIGLDAVSFLASALLLAAIPRSFNVARAADAAETARAGRSLVRRTLEDIREGLAFLWQQRIVRALTLLGVGNSLSGGAIVGLLVVYAVHGLGLAENDPQIGLLYTAAAVGGLLASLLLPRLTRRFPVGRITLVGLAANLTLMWGVALAPNLWSGLLLIGVWHAGHTLVIINAIVLRQQVTPDHLQGRVNITARMIAWGGAPVGAVLGGLLAEATTIRVALMVMTLGVAASALIGWFSPLREPESPLVAVDPAAEPRG